MTSSHLQTFIAQECISFQHHRVETRLPSPQRLSQICIRSILEEIFVTTPPQKSWFLTKYEIIDLSLLANYPNMTQHGTYKSGPWGDVQVSQRNKAMATHVEGMQVHE